MSDDSPMPLALKLDRIGKTYGGVRGPGSPFALIDLTLTIGAGEAIVIAGANGAGKSTALRIAAGIEIPSSGDVAIFGRKPTELATRRRTAWLADNSELFPFLDAQETLAFASAMGRGGRGERRDRVDRYFSRWGLTAFAKKKVKSYSLGMRRRLAIAAALVTGADLFLLDEPIGGLDPEGQALFAQMMDEEKKRGAAIVISSHHLGRAEAFADRLCILRSGRMLLEGQLDEIAARLAARDVTTKGLSDDDLVLLAKRAEELGGSLEAARLPAAALESLILGDDEEPA